MFKISFFLFAVTLECQIATLESKTSLSLFSICGVRDISGIKKTACFPCFKISFIVFIYISVLPAPVFAKSTVCLQAFSNILKDQIPLIGVGGILSGEQAIAKQQAGASLVQIYSGLIYTGPALIKDCVNAMT